MLQQPTYSWYTPVHPTVDSLLYTVLLLNDDYFNDEFEFLRTHVTKDNFVKYAFRTLKLKRALEADVLRFGL